MAIQPRRDLLVGQPIGRVENHPRALHLAPRRSHLTSTTLELVALVSAHAQTVEGLRRELQGCERRLLELDHMRSHRPPPPEWAFEDAEKAKANVLAELERLDPPKTIKKERK